MIQKGPSGGGQAVSIPPSRRDRRRSATEATGGGELSGGPGAVFLTRQSKNGPGDDGRFQVAYETIGKAGRHQRSFRPRLHFTPPYDQAESVSLQEGLDIVALESRTSGGR